MVLALFPRCSFFQIRVDKTCFAKNGFLWIFLSNFLGQEFDPKFWKNLTYPPWELTANAPENRPLERRFLLETIIFKGYDSFRTCILFGFSNKSSFFFWRVVLVRCDLPKTSAKIHGNSWSSKTLMTLSLNKKLCPTKRTNPKNHWTLL